MSIAKTVRFLRGIFLANEIDDGADVVATDNNFLFVANEHKPEGGWVQLAPYGDWKHSMGTQRFQKEDAEKIVSSFKSIGLANIGVRTMGIPFYIGHPDHEAFSGKPGHQDTKAYGRIKQMEARDTGLFANIKWSGEGKKLIEDGAFHGHSVNWLCTVDSGFYRPKSLKSVGLTNNPNIAVAPITQANEKETIMLKELIKIYGLAENATEADVKAKAQQIANELSTAQASIVALKKFETEAPTLASKITALEAEKTTLANQVATLTTERDGAKTSLANERKERSKLLLDAAQKEGRITEADRKAYETEFANDAAFDATITKLGNAKKSGLPLGKQSATEGRGRGMHNMDSQDRQEKVLSLVNEAMDKHKIDYTTAFARVMREKPELFEVKSDSGE